MVVHGNRGKCAQPCRLPYELIAKDNQENITQTLSKGYLLSPRDLCGLNYIPELIKAGVMCFKIEGRMKSPEYVATTTRIYRKYIDLALSDKPYIIDEKDVKDLMQVFNRGNFSSGHLDSKPNKDLIYPKKQNHMGIYIGNVSNVKQNKGHVLLNLTDSISIGDTIQFEKETTKYTISELMIKNKNIPSANEGQFVEIGRMKGNINIGDKIYKIASKELSNIAKASYQSENKKVLLNASITLRKDEPVALKVSTVKSENNIFNNINVELYSEETPLEAKNRPIDKEKILSQLVKTNDTIFEFNNIDINLQDNLFLPSFKIINELRRSVLNEVLIIAQSRILRKPPIIDIQNKHIKNKSSNKKKQISVLLNLINKDLDYTQLENVDNIYIPLRYFSNKDLENVINKISDSFNTYIYLPTIIKGNYKNLLKNIAEKSIDKYKIKGFVISNLGNIPFVNYIKEHYNNKFEFIGNYTLNVYNTNTIQELQNLGISKLTVSPELDLRTMQSVTDYSILPQELIVYGRTPLMNANYCFLGKTNKCFPTCGMHCIDDAQYYLKDRMGLSFPIIPDKIQTVTTIYNSKITSIDGSLFNAISYRIDILDEDIENIKHIINCVLNNKRLEGKEFTNGNLNREI